jgi:hypothetical protein
VPCGSGIEAGLMVGGGRGGGVARGEVDRASVRGWGITRVGAGVGVREWDAEPAMGHARGSGSAVTEHPCSGSVSARGCDRPRERAGRGRAGGARGHGS